MSDNIHIITNVFEWDENGKALKVLEPKIHALNKSEVAIKDYPIFNKIEGRKNVLLLGDSIDDIGMVDGFEYNEIIKVGFLNEKVEENQKRYLEGFDVLITRDGDMSYINELLKEIVG